MALTLLPAMSVPAMAADTLTGMAALEAAGIDTTAEGILPLKAVFEDHFMVGNTLGTDAHKLYHYNAMTPDNNTKPDMLWSGTSNPAGTPTTTSPTFNYQNIITNANNAGVYTIGHALAWHNQSRNWPARSSDRPTWNATTGAFTPIVHYWDNATARAQLERYIKEIAGHFSSEYQGTTLTYQLDAWNVVNEMMRDNPEHPEDWRNALRSGDMPLMRPSNWYGAYENGGNGWDYVYDAFLWARKYAPDAELIINDFNDEELSNKAIAIAEMVKELNAKYANEYPSDPRMLIEIIGIQGHYNTRLNLDNLEEVIQIYVATGCKIAITELDVSIPDTTSFTPTTAQLQEHANFYARLFIMLKKYSTYIDRVTWWGAADNANSRGSFHPMLFTTTAGNSIDDVNRGTPKEAYWATVYPELYLGIPKELPVLTSFNFGGENIAVNVIPKYDVNVPKDVTNIDFTAANLVFDGGDDVNVNVTLNPANGAVSAGRPCVATVELTWKDSPQNKDNTTKYEISFGHMSAEWVKDWNYADTGYRSAVNVRFSDGVTALTLNQEFVSISDGETALLTSKTFPPLPKHGASTLAVATAGKLDEAYLETVQLRKSVIYGSSDMFIPVKTTDFSVPEYGWKLAKEIIPGNTYMIVSSASGLALTHEGRSSVAAGDGITSAVRGYFGTPVNVEGDKIVSTERVPGSPTTVIQDHLRFWLKPLTHPNPGPYTEANGYTEFGLQSLVLGGLVQPYFIWRMTGEASTIRINSESHISDVNLDRGAWFNTPIDPETGETTLFLYTPGSPDLYYGLASNSNGFVAEKIADINNPTAPFIVKLYEYTAINEQPAGTPPTITTIALDTATVGSTYGFTLAANGDSAITWGISLGALPYGLSLDNITGTISGTPMVAGTFNFNVSATNDAGSDTKELSITVNESSTTYTITFNANGGSVLPPSAVTGADGKLTSLPTPTRSSYTFDGWFTLVSGGTQVITSTVFSSNDTIYAQWTYSGSTTSTTEPGKTPEAPPAKDSILPGGGIVATPESTPPKKDDDGTITLPGGGEIKTPGGTKIDAPAGTTIAPDGKITIGTGGATITYPDGTSLSLPEGLEIILDDEVPLGFFAVGLPFVDVLPDDWFFDDVLYVFSLGLMTGTSTTTFSPQVSMTRGMVVTVLGRLAGIDIADYAGESFGDVDAEMYYAPYIKWAAEKGIVNGIGDNKFAPNADISRQDLTVILARYAEIMGLTMKQTLQNVVFVDSDTIAEYAVNAVGTMVRAGVINGKDGGGFDPAASATRAEVAAMLHRFCEAVK